MWETRGEIPPGHPAPLAGPDPSLAWPRGGVVPELADLRLARVQCRGPGRPGPVPLLILSWEAAAGNAHPFAVLNADITLIPDGDGAVLLGLAGVYVTPQGTRSGQPAVRTAAAVTVRALLSHIADAIINPAAPAVQADGHGAPPGGLSCASPAPP
jgi:hypothetical protein